MSVPSNNGREPTQAEIDREIHRVFAESDHIKPDGSPSWAKARMKLASEVCEAKVTDRRERGVNAVQRGVLVTRVWPAIVPPDDHAGHEFPKLVEAVWKQFWSDIWTELRTGHNQPIQKLVNVMEGGGWVMCRTKVGPDKVGAVYITENRDLIRDDMTRPANQEAARRAVRDARNREMLMVRQPHNAAAYMAEYVKAMETALETGKEMLELTMGTLHTDAEEEDGE